MNKQETESKYFIYIQIYGHAKILLIHILVILIDS